MTHSIECRAGVRLAISTMLRLMCDADVLTSQPRLLTHEQRQRIAAAVRGLAVAGSLGDFSMDEVSAAPLWPTL